jgi:hypothetical protein
VSASKMHSGILEIAVAHDETLSNIVTEIDKTRQQGSNLSSAIAAQRRSDSYQSPPALRFSPSQSAEIVSTLYWESDTMAVARRCAPHSRCRAP